MSPAPAESRTVWCERLYARLRSRPQPLLDLPTGILPAASLWTGLREWVRAWRAAGLERGDRVAVALPPSAAWLNVVLSAFCEGLTVALLPPGAGPSTWAELDPRLVVTAGGAGTVVPDPDGLPPEPWPPPGGAPLASAPPCPAVRLIARTSGTSGRGRWVALSDANLLSVIDSHAPHFGLGEDSRVLSVLPWHHLFGLVIDLLPALLAGAEIRRDPAGGRDPASLVAQGRVLGATWLCAVPLTIERVLATPGGKAWLRELAGGVIGGAALSAPAASALAGSRLRVGYGQTEAGPGICLGEPGDLRPGYLGRPVGCEVRAGEDSILEFRGPNSCLGFWEGGHLVPNPWTDWMPTGDVVERAGEGWIFRGRADDRFKLPNGRAVCAEELERRIALAAGLDRVWVATTEGGRIRVVYNRPDEGRSPVGARVRSAVPEFERWLEDPEPAEPDFWQFSAKGALDRPALARRWRERNPARAREAAAASGVAPV